MDWRWQPCAKDTKRDFKAILHPTAAIYEVRRGLEPGSDDSVDISEFVTLGTQTAFEVSLTLEFNRELFGASQPQPNQVLEIQLKERGEWKPVWLGFIDAISSYTLQRGKRSLQLTAKTRDQQDVWRKTKRTTPLFPQLTDFTYMAVRVARTAGLQGDEIMIPSSSFTTAHSNTQLAGMTAWDMMEQIFLPLGWTPFIDSVGRLKAADRGLQGRQADVVLADERVVKVGGQRQRSPVSRVRVAWLNPTLKKDLRQGQLLTQQVITLGWFLPYWKQTVYFSQDKTLRAEGTYMRANPSCNTTIGKVKIGAFVIERYQQQGENKGRMSFTNTQTYAVVAMMATMVSSHLIPDPVAGIGGGATIPSAGGGLVRSVAHAALLYMMLAVGTGTYEIWGQPYEWVHARNLSEAFDSSVPVWVDSPEDIESDFITNEAHAKAVAIRELIYQVRSANKWTASIVDDPRIEYGDILQFTDGSQLYVEDFSRNLERGSEATLEVRGFLIPVTRIVSGQAVTPPPGGGGG